MIVDTEALKRRMGNRFYTGARLARELGLSRTAVYQILRGKSQPKPENLKHICEILECDPEEIVKEW